jgi:hypothetical protein
VGNEIEFKNEPLHSPDARACSLTKNKSINIYSIHILKSSGKKAVPSFSLISRMKLKM